MEPSEILAKVIGVLAEQAEKDPSEITADTTLDNDGIGFDSLDQVEAVMAVEEAFDVTFPEGQAEGAETVAAVVKLVQQALAEKAAKAA